MVKLKKRERSGAEIPTASMSDISFLLLLFFLVTTTIDVDTGIGLTLPEYIPPEEQKQVEISRDRFMAVLINENGDVLLNNEIIAIPQIKKTLVPKIEERINVPANKKLVVSIKTDRKTNYNRYIQALDQVKGAYYDVQGQYAMANYGKKLYELTNDERDAIRDKIPISISIAEPETVKQ